MRVLVIAAHPDDEVFGMGGTIARHVKNNDKVYTCILSESTTSQYKSLPKEEIEKLKKQIHNEAKKANKFLGVKKIFYFGLPDAKLDTLAHADINHCIEKCITEVKPDIVYTHYPDDTSLDHQITAKSTLVATRPTIGTDKSFKKSGISKILFYEIPVVTSLLPANKYFIPNYFVDISKTLRKKLMAGEEISQCQTCNHKLLNVQVFLLYILEFW